MKIFKKILITLVLMATAYFLFGIYKSHLRPDILQKEKTRSEAWKSATINFRKKSQKGKIVFVGNSLTSGLPPFLPKEERILVFGIPGDFTLGVINRLPELVAAEPVQLFLEIGINDILAGFKKNAILANHTKIIKTLRKQLPNCKLYVQSIFPTNFESGFFVNSSEANEVILEINSSLKELCRANGATYVDLHTPFSENGALRKEYTIDGVHLTAKGYKEWVTVLMGYL